MGQATILLFWLATMLYVGATVLYAYFFATKSRRMSIAATMATGLGFIAHTTVIALRWIESGTVPIAGSFNSLALVAWWVVLVYFVVEHLVKIKTLGVLMLPAAVILMVWAGVNYQPPPGMESVVQSTHVYVHLALIFVAYGAFALGAGAGALYLVQERQLKKKRTGAFFRRLPPLDVLDDLERKAIVFGVPFITGGLVMGIARALARAGTPGVPANWYTDPLVLLAIFTWAFYVGYLLLRRVGGWEGRRSAWMAIVGLLLISAIRFLATLNLPVFHRFGGG